MKKTITFFRLLPVILLALLLTGSGVKAWGQISITSIPYSPPTTDFNSFNPTSVLNLSSTLPTGWTASISGTAAYNGRTSTPGTTGGYYGFGSTTDYSIGALRTNGAGNITYAISFTNNTGSTITSVTLSWNYEQWKGVNTSGWDCSGTGQLSGNSILNGKDFTGSATAVAGATTAIPTFTLSGLSISNGQTFGIQWVTTDASGSDNPVSIDDFTITASATSLSSPPSLTADATLNIVDNNIDISFIDDATWRAAVTAVKIGGTALTVTTDYLLTAGNLQLIPSGGNALLTTAGSKAVTIEATGYSAASVTQQIDAGAPSKLGMKTQPTAPATNGVVLAAQPEVYIQDQYGNTTNSTASVTAAVGSGAWTISGTTTKTGVSGTATFTDLTATSAASVTGATIAFSSTGLTGVTSNAFNIPAPAPGNNLCTNATSITIDATAINGTLVSATYTSPFTSKNDVWYSFTPSGTGNHIITVGGFTGDIDVEVYSNSNNCPSSTTYLYNATTSSVPEVITNSFSSGTTYYIRVLAYNTTAESSTFTISVASVAALSTNSVSSLSFSSQVSGTSSTSQTFNLSGVNLKNAPGNITVTAPNTDFQVSNDNSTWGATTTISYSSATLDATLVYVKFTPQSTGAKSGNITFSGGSVASPPTVALTGTGTIDIPVASSATSIQPTSFSANWSAVTGATGGYQLDVATTSSMPNNLTLTEGFETGLTGSYFTGNVSLSSGSWSLTKVMKGGTGVNSGSSSAQLESSTGSALVSPALANGISTISFWVTSSTTSGALQVNYSTDGGTTWLSAPGSPFTGLGNTKVQKTINLNITAASTKIQFYRTAATIYIDDVKIGYFDGTPTFIAGYNSKAIAGQSTVSSSVTGLTPNTTYYYRVRAVGTNSTSANSNVITAFTAIDGAVNASAMPDCATCDVVVATGGSLTVNANKSYNKVTVNPGGKLTLANGKTLTAPLTIESNAENGTGTYVDENTGTGLPAITGTVQQWLTGKTGTSTRANWYLSSPVNGATANVFDVASLTNKITYYDETVPGYVTQITDNSTELAPGRGYVTYIGGADAAYTFTGGTLNNGDITITPTRTGTTAAKRGFNLVGNPYPSYLDWNSVALTKTKLRSTIWYRTLLKDATAGEMTFDTFDGTTGTSNGQNGVVSQFIPPMQAFWVKVNADGDVASLVFRNAARLHKDQSLETNRLRAPSQATELLPIVRLKVSNGIFSDEAIIVGDNNATDLLDAYDSEKMTNNNTAIPEIATLAGNQELVINHLNSITAEKQLTLGFRPGQTGTNFTIEATQLENIDAKVMLLDKVAGTEQELTAGTPYSFTVSDATPTTDRFVISFAAKVPTGIETGTANGDMTVYTNRNNRIQVIYRGELNDQTTVSVYNVAGQMLSTQKLVKASTELSGTYRPGVYMIQLTDNGKKMTQKLIIK